MNIGRNCLGLALIRLFGGNNFELPIPNEKIWDKTNAKFAQCEQAWTNIRFQQNIQKKA